MKEEQNIKEQMQIFSSKFGPASLIPAVVTAINDDDTVAVTTSDDVMIDDVRLKSVVKTGTKFIVTPALNSNILIGRIENSEEFIVAAVDELKEVRIEISDTSIVADENGIVMNGGNLHGLVTRDGVKGQLNKIEQDITNLKSAINTWVPVANDGGAALKAATASWSTSTLIQTVSSDIENTKVKQ